MQIRSISCLMCSQLEQFQSIQIVRKALFFKLISTPIYTRSFSRGFSLATSSYVLDGRTALIAAKLYCGLGNYSQTAIFPRMPSITRIYQVLLTWVCSWKLDASYWKIYKRTKVVPLASSTSQSKRRGFLRPLCIRSTTAGLKEH